MADRVSASIVVGGTVTTNAFAELANVIASEDLRVEWDGEPFEPHHHTPGEPLSLYAHEVAWGRFKDLEAWCVAHGLPFARWSGGFGSSWGPGRVLFIGDGEPVTYIADEEDRILIDRASVEALGSVDAILAYFDAADAAIPPLVVEGDPQAVGRAAA